jgi:hypothetical protein
MHLFLIKSAYVALIEILQKIRRGIQARSLSGVVS